MPDIAAPTESIGRDKAPSAATAVPRMASLIFLGTLINAAIFPFAAKAVGASEFGYAGAAMAWVAVLAPLADMGSTAQLAVCHRGNIRTLIARVVGCSLIVCACFFLTQTLCNFFLHWPRLSLDLVCSCFLLFTSLVLQNWAVGLCTRRARTASYAGARLIQSVIGATATVVLALIYPTAGSILVGQSLGQFASAAFLIVPELKGFDFSSLLRWDGSADKCEASLLAAGCLGLGESMRRIALQIPLLATSFFLPSQTVGQVTLAIRIASLPVTIVGVVVTQSTVAGIARLTRRNEVGNAALLLHAARQLGFSSAAFATITVPSIIILSSANFFPLLGEDYKFLGVFYAVILPGYLCQAIAAPFLQSFPFLAGYRAYGHLLTTRLCVLVLPTPLLLSDTMPDIKYLLCYSFGVLVMSGVAIGVALRRAYHTDTQRTILY